MIISHDVLIVGSGAAGLYAAYWASEKADVAVSPGIGFGEHGEGFVRIALVENEQRLRQAARNIKRYLASMGVNSSAA